MLKPLIRNNMVHIRRLIFDLQEQIDQLIIKTWYFLKGFFELLRVLTSASDYAGMCVRFLIWTLTQAVWGVKSIVGHIIENFKAYNKGFSIDLPL